MEFFYLCLRIIKEEKKMFNLDQQKMFSCISQYSITDTFYESPYIRCGFMYKYGTSTLIFIQDCVKKFLTTYPKIDSLLLQWNFNPQLKLCSVNCGPALDYIAFTLALHECMKTQALPCQPQFKSIHVISEFAQWKKTFNIMIKSLKEGSIKDFPIFSLCDEFNITQDSFNSLSTKQKTVVEGADVIFMTKMLRIPNPADASTNRKKLYFKEFIATMKESSVLFCIDTKPSIEAMADILNESPGKYIFEPITNTSKFPGIYPDTSYKELYGSFPASVYKGYFFVWKKLSLNFPIKSRNSAMTESHSVSSDYVTTENTSISNFQDPSYVDSSQSEMDDIFYNNFSNGIVESQNCDLEKHTPNLIWSDSNDLMHEYSSTYPLVDINAPIERQTYLDLKDVDNAIGNNSLCQGSVCFETTCSIELKGLANDNKQNDITYCNLGDHDFQPVDTVENDVKALLSEICDKLDAGYSNIPDSPQKVHCTDSAIESNRSIQESMILANFELNTHSERNSDKNVLLEKMKFDGDVQILCPGKINNSSSISSLSNCMNLEEIIFKESKEKILSGGSGKKLKKLIPYVNNFEGCFTDDSISNNIESEQISERFYNNENLSSSIIRSFTPSLFDANQINTSENFKIKKECSLENLNENIPNNINGNKPLKKKRGRRGGRKRKGLKLYSLPVFSSKLGQFPNKLEAELQQNSETLSSNSNLPTSSMQNSTASNVSDKNKVKVNFKTKTESNIATSNECLFDKISGFKTEFDDQNKPTTSASYKVKKSIKIGDDTEMNESNSTQIQDLTDKIRKIVASVENIIADHEQRKSDIVNSAANLNYEVLPHGKNNFVMDGTGLRVDKSTQCNFNKEVSHACNFKGLPSCQKECFKSEIKCCADEENLKHTYRSCQNVQFSRPNCCTCNPIRAHGCAHQILPNCASSVLETQAANNCHHGVGLVLPSPKILCNVCSQIQENKTPNIVISLENIDNSALAGIIALLKAKSEA